MIRRTRLSLRWRVAIAFGVGALLFTGLFATATWNLATGYMLGQREAGAAQQAELNVRLVDSALRAGSDGPDELLQGLSTDTETTVLLRRPEGWITSGRQIGPEALPDPLIELATAGVPAQQRLRVAGVLVLAVTLPVASPDTAYVELSRSRSWIARSGSSARCSPRAWRPARCSGSVWEHGRAGGRCAR